MPCVALALCLVAQCLAPVVAQSAFAEASNHASKGHPDTLRAPRASPMMPMHNFKWLDEGQAARGSLSQWDESRTFCFYENASLNIRLDPLNSTLQPYVVRAFGQSPEAQAVHDFTVESLRYLQEYAWPLRSFFWAWSNLRVVISGSDVEQLRFSFARAPGAICSSLLYLSEASTQLEEYVVPEVVSGFQTFLHGLSLVLCENCVQGCPLDCIPIAGDNPSCMLLLSPYHAPCVAVTSPAKPFLATLPPAFSFSVSFYTVLSSIYVQNFFLGLILFYSATRLSKSRTFHYLLGASIGIAFSAVLALYFFSRQTKSASRMIPGSQLFQSIGAMVSFVVPFTGFVLMPSLYRVMSWGVSYLIWFWGADEVLGIPHLGKIYFACFGFIGCVLVWWNQWGATPKSSEQEQDAEEIAEIGYLEEDLPLTTSQTALTRLLQLIGLTLLFHSTSSTEASLILVSLALLTGFFQSIATTAYFWYHYERPGRHTKLISRKEYEKQGQTETEKALKALQEYLRTNPDEMDKVKEEHEIRLRRFAKGRNHMDVSSREPTMPNVPQRSGWWCVVQ
ncbi:hypothetical protein Poli38472_008890 [Pythium oligandrum]|uniref:Uncharacterized protein n=1 Tax=Pythium oligandrum TaxID=41045 RepID=A0A8K1C4B4_PYTOL|nr:hypothetical protein Poli38472_008890 [Pythium oligandrum]|eukprot:TMW56242.1 hypothetical protein Poli38472_008890 [Pythium oligandrum]